MDKIIAKILTPIFRHSQSKIGAYWHFKPYVQFKLTLNRSCYQLFTFKCLLGTRCLRYCVSSLDCPDSPSLFKEVYSIHSLQWNTRIEIVGAMVRSKLASAVRCTAVQLYSCTAVRCCVRPQSSEPCVQLYSLCPGFHNSEEVSNTGSSNYWKITSPPRRKGWVVHPPFQHQNRKPCLDSMDIMAYCTMYYSTSGAFISVLREGLGVALPYSCSVLTLKAGMCFCQAQP